MIIKIFASGSKGNSYLLSDGEFSLLLEAGISYKEIQRGMDFDMSKVEGCLISHSHFDHAKCVRDLAHRGIDVYMTYETIIELNLPKNDRFKICMPYIPTFTDHFIIMPFWASHDVPCVGYLIGSKSNNENTLFVTDTGYLKYDFKDLNHIMIECNYSEEIMTKLEMSGEKSQAMCDRIRMTHLGLHQVKEFLQKNDLSKVQKIILLHGSDLNSDSTQFVSEIQSLTGIPTEVA